MAGADYRSCDVCGGKAFYDAQLNYDIGEKVNGKWTYSDTPYKVAGVGQGEYGVGLDYIGDWAVICTACAKTHRTAILPIEAALKETKPPVSQQTYPRSMMRGDFN